MMLYLLNLAGRAPVKIIPLEKHAVSTSMQLKFHYPLEKKLRIKLFLNQLMITVANSATLKILSKKDYEKTRIKKYKNIFVVSVRDTFQLI